MVTLIYGCMLSVVFAVTLPSVRAPCHCFSGAFVFPGLCPQQLNSAAWLAHVFDILRHFFWAPFFFFFLSVNIHCRVFHISFFSSLQMEDGQTLFDYNVGLNDIIQLLIRSQAELSENPAAKDSPGVACGSAPSADSKLESRNSSSAPASPAAMETNTDNDKSAVTIGNASETKPDTSTTSNSASTKNGFKSPSSAQDQPPTSSKNTLIDPGIGVYKVRGGEGGGDVWEM